MGSNWVFLVSLLFVSGIGASPAMVVSRSESLASESQLMKKSFESAFVENIRTQLATRLGEPLSELRVEVNHLQVQPPLEQHRIRSVQVLGLGSLSSRRLEGLMTVPVFVQYETPSGERELEHSVSGVLQVTGPVCTTKNSLPRGHVVEAQDLNMTSLPWRGLANDVLGLSRALITGRRVKSQIPAGVPVSAAFLDAPLAVSSGETVDLTVLSGPGVMIRSRAVAKQEGRVGDIVRVEQPDTKKAMSAVITGPRRVEVQL